MVTQNGTSENNLGWNFDISLNSYTSWWLAVPLDKQEKLEQCQGRRVIRYWAMLMEPSQLGSLWKEFCKRTVRKWGCELTHRPSLENCTASLFFEGVIVWAHKATNKHICAFMLFTKFFQFLHTLRDAHAVDLRFLSQLFHNLPLLNDAFLQFSAHDAESHNNLQIAKKKKKIWI